MFKKVDLYDLKQNVFQEINKNWMLLTAKNKAEEVNTMTVSWGAMGEIWGKEAVTVYVRESRYTKEFIDDQDYFTLSLFDGHKEELGVLGTKSGRDGDKIAEVGFSIEEVEGQPTFKESKCVFICKKMHQMEMPVSDMSEEIKEKWYADGNEHTMYIAEIVACYVNE